MAVDERNNCKFLDNWRLTTLSAFIGARLLRRNSSKFNQNITHRQTDETCHKPSPATTATVIHSFIHSFIYLHSSKNIIHNNMYMQDNKAAYATLTVALYNWEIKHYCTSRTH